MKYRATRGVCVGVAQHLKPGDVSELEPALAKYLLHIRAVEEVVEPAPKPEPAPAVVGKKEK